MFAHPRATHLAYPYGTYGAPQPAPSSATKTFGLVSVVLGAVYGVWSVVAVLQAALMSGMSTVPPAPAGDAEAQVLSENARRLMEASVRLELRQGSVMLVMNIVLVVAGTLLFHNREVGRRLLIGWSIAALFVLLGRAAAFELVVFPLTMSTFSAAAKGMDDYTGTMRLMMRASTYGGLLVMAVFPVTTFFVMRSRGVRAALSPTSSA